MNKILDQTLNKLSRSKKTLAVAESCTGGLLSQLLTQKPGSSKYFIAGIVTYSNTAKQKFLNIPARTIAKNGAVSAIVARLMAQQVRKLSQTDFGIGITGIAGPGGGTKNKPIGIVFISASKKTKTLSQKLKLKGSRAKIRKLASIHALELFLKIL